jgi:hypothetical protein
VDLCGFRFPPGIAHSALQPQNHLCDPCQKRRHARDKFNTIDSSQSMISQGCDMESIANVGPGDDNRIHLDSLSSMAMTGIDLPTAGCWEIAARYTGAGPIRNSCAKRFTNGLGCPNENRTGRRAFTTSNGNERSRTMPPYEPWRSNGSAFCSGVARTPFRSRTHGYQVCLIYLKLFIKDGGVIRSSS